MRMDKVIVDKLENLGQAIKDLDRKKADECKQVAELFALLPSVATPMTVTKGERPDFIIEAGGHKTGIEVTWSCHQGWEEAENYLGSPKNKTLSMISRNWFIGENARGKRQGRYLEAKQGDSTTWGSREMAAEWTNQMIDALLRKTASFEKEGFQKFEKNWLLIADKMPFEFLDLDAALESLNFKAAGLEKEAPYNEVYILTQVRGEKILISRRKSGYECIARGVPVNKCVR